MSTSGKVKIPIMVGYFMNFVFKKTISPIIIHIYQPLRSGRV